MHLLYLRGPNCIGFFSKALLAYERIDILIVSDCNVALHLGAARFQILAMSMTIL
jgi:hypothetical protein